jgi:undecaprenyl-phosphate 4-deoxy-4-formamido-L-arabinose transferase
MTEEGDLAMSDILAHPVSVLMPVCNEADIIAGVLDEWLDEVLQHLPDGSELILEDSSHDGTTEILLDYAQRHDFIRVNWHFKDGFFKAAMRAYRRATCPLIFFTDSDGQYVPREFWKIAAEINDFDMVHGVKRKRCDPAYRVLASRCFNRVAQRVTGFEGSDINSAFRLLHKRVLDAVLDQIHTMPTLLNAELYLRAKQAGFRVKDVDVEHRTRKHGVSRGLPRSHFLIECWNAYRGLIQLKRELAQQSADRVSVPFPAGRNRSRRFRDRYKSIAS